MLEEAAASGTTVIVATHKPTFQAGRVLRLPEGKLLVRRGLLKEAAGAQPLWRRLLPQNGNGSGHNGNGHNGNGHNGSNGHVAIAANGHATRNGKNGHGPQARRRKASKGLPLWRRFHALPGKRFRRSSLCA